MQRTLHISGHALTVSASGAPVSGSFATLTAVADPVRVKAPRHIARAISYLCPSIFNRYSIFDILQSSSIYPLSSLVPRPSSRLTHLPFSIFLLILFPLVAPAQSLFDRVTCANAFYANAKSLSLSMEYRMFTDASARTPAEVTKGQYLKSGSRSYSDINGRISVVTERTAVTVDPQTRVLTVAGPGTATFNPWGDYNEETLYKVFDKRELISHRDGLLHYSLTPAAKLGNEVTRMDIWFDDSHCFIRRIVMYFRQMELPGPDGKPVKQLPRVEIEYTSVKWDTAPDPSIFSTDRYLRWDGNKPVLTPAYRDYALINSLMP